MPGTWPAQACALHSAVPQSPNPREGQQQDPLPQSHKGGGGQGDWGRGNGSWGYLGHGETRLPPTAPSPPRGLRAGRGPAGIREAHRPPGYCLNPALKRPYSQVAPSQGVGTRLHRVSIDPDLSPRKCPSCPLSPWCQEGARPQLQNGEAQLDSNARTQLQQPGTQGTSTQSLPQSHSHGNQSLPGVLRPPPRLCAMACRGDAGQGRAGPEHPCPKGLRSQSELEPSRGTTPRAPTETSLCPRG